MKYSIGQVAKKLGITTYTLRYYDKEGLLPFVKKGTSGARVFEDKDVDWLIILECLKKTGMSLKDIKVYLELCRQGDATLKARLELFQQQKLKLEEQIKQFKAYQEKIDFKIAYYTNAVKNGGINICERNKCLAKERRQLLEHK